MSSLEFFDACAQIGTRTKGQSDQPHLLSDYLADMEHHGISCGVVYHSTAREYDPATGNQQLMEELAAINHPSSTINHVLHPQWLVLPPDTEELPEPGILISQMRAAGVTSARIFPKLQNFIARSFFLGDLLDALQQEQLPLFAEFGELTWDDVIHISSEFPKLKIVLTRVGYRETRSLPAILRKLSNVTLDTALLANHFLLEDFCSRYGNGRFVYSSLWPFLPPANAITMIGYADISDDDKMAIASGNLTRLLEGTRNA